MHLMSPPLTQARQAAPLHLMFLMMHLMNPPLSLARQAALLHLILLVMHLMSPPLTPARQAVRIVHREGLNRHTTEMVVKRLSQLTYILHKDALVSVQIHL